MRWWCGPFFSTEEYQLSSAGFTDCAYTPREASSGMMVLEGAVFFLLLYAVRASFSSSSSFSDSSLSSSCSSVASDMILDVC